ncbi:MAG: sulfatase-like hydrolase/transferase, partial [Thermoanaerobaculia bacterium]|nr:sulfatase-like hydrolase/transferase [Thermoanaerobaculia bacterium]
MSATRSSTSPVGMASSRLARACEIAALGIPASPFSSACSRGNGASSKLSAAAPAKPNILFVLSDDHSYPFLGCYGDTNVRTPTLDAFAAEGMKFHRFFTVAPQCVPSRAGFLTGRSAVAARMTRFSSPLPRDEITFPEILRQQGGYYTGIAGRSYHLDGSSGANSSGTVTQLLATHGLKT